MSSHLGTLQLKLQRGMSHCKTGQQPSKLHAILPTASGGCQAPLSLTPLVLPTAGKTVQLTPGSQANNINIKPSSNPKTWVSSPKHSIHSGPVTAAAASTVSACTTEWPALGAA
ncbi:hypothetical protein ABBQ38_003647 [Trebouxia sp. C0009 RCD-2024]